MRKFLPRFFTVLSFLACLMVILPFAALSSLFQVLSDVGGFFGIVFNNIAWFFYYFEWLKISFIPGFCLVVSLLYFFVSLIDRATHDKQNSIPIKSATYLPIVFFTFASLICAVYAMFFDHVNFVLRNVDFYALGYLINLVLPAAAKAWIESFPFFNYIFYGTVLVLELLMLLSLKNLHKKGFFGKFFALLGFLLIAALASKGSREFFAIGRNDVNLNFLVCAGLSNVHFDLSLLSQFHSFNYFTEAGYQFSLPFLVELIAAGVILILFIIFSIIAVKHVKKVERREKLAKEGVLGNNNALVEEFVPRVGELEEGQSEIDEGLFVLPQPEDVIETEVEEKTVIKQVVYEESDLNARFSTDFEFKNTAMVKKEGYTEYFVNKQKFLSLTNSGKQMSFRLELDKAIKLIIQYPLVGKDKYENHKIWFKIDDTSILNKDVVIAIIKDAYDTVLNNQ